MKQTNWIVITGAPSSGKTKTIEFLERKGYYVVHEAARILIDDELKIGKKIEEIRVDEIAFNQKVLQMKIKIEESISENQLHFFDRGIPDSIAYAELYGENTLLAKQSSIKKRYKTIFQLNPLPFEKDYARMENEEHFKKLDKLIYNAYSDLGYSINRVPVMSIEKRVEFILNKI